MTKDELKEYKRVWIANRRKQFFHNKSCIQCGSNIKLELHHRDPAQKKDHKIWSWSKERQESEIAKCDVLCHGCHQQITRQQLQVSWKHGTRDGYATFKCRCATCKEAQRIYMRKYRANKRETLQ